MTVIYVNIHLKMQLNKKNNFGHLFIYNSNMNKKWKQKIEFFIRLKKEDKINSKSKLLLYLEEVKLVVSNLGCVI